MRQQWYGDNRDLVKWGVVLYLAQAYSLKRILQVAYLRPSKWGRLEIDGEEHPIPEAVLNHLRDMHNIQRLECEPEIEVIDMPFEDRVRYDQAVAHAVSRQHPCMVLLDPDTGLEPEGVSRLEHVLNSEVGQVWNAMVTGDVLACYQHRTNRNGRQWIEPKREQLEKALELLPGSIKVASGKDAWRERCCDLLLPQVSGTCGPGSRAVSGTVENVMG